MNSRLYYILKVFDILLKEAKQRGITKILLNGDIFEETDYIGVEVYDGVYRKLEKLHSEGMDTVINLGNHDLHLQSGGRMLHSLRPFRRVARIVEESQLIWNHLQVVPYMGDSEELKRTLHSLRASRSYGLVLHCGVQGARAGPTAYLVRNPIHLRDIRPKEFGVVILSDYHTTQHLRSNVFYMGSPIQHSFGEIHRPCIWDIKILDSSPYFQTRKIYTDFPRFKRVRARRREEIEEKLGDLSGNYVRVILPAGSKVSDETIEELAQRGNFLFQVEREGEEREDGEVAIHTLDARELISKYVSANVRGNARARRLISLGTALYEGKTE